MAAQRDQPYLQFNFLVDLGTGSTEGPDAGFAEVSGIGLEGTVPEYRVPNGRESRIDSSITKITGINKFTDVTLKRGVIGSLPLDDWLDQSRNGALAADRTVTLQLQNEDHTQIVQTWRLRRAWIIKFTLPVYLKGTHVAVEELVLACERVEME